MGIQQTAERYILIVEDSPVDYEIATRALRKAEYEDAIHRCEDGDEAIDFLRGENEVVREKGNPSLILLDLNLPGTDGREVLQHIKNDSEIAHIPVVVLTTSNNEFDIEACYENGANSYVKKPTSPDDYVAMAKVLKSFWFEWASLPEEHDR